MIYFF